MPNPPENLTRLEMLAKRLNHLGTAPVVFLIGGLVLLWHVIYSQREWIISSWEWFTNAGKSAAEAGGDGLSEAMSNLASATAEAFTGLPPWVVALLGVAYLANTPRKWRIWPLKLWLATMVALFIVMMLGLSLLWGSIVFSVSVFLLMWRDIERFYDKARQNRRTAANTEPDTE